MKLLMQPKDMAKGMNTWAIKKWKVHVHVRVTRKLRTIIFRPYNNKRTELI